MLKTIVMPLAAALVLACEAASAGDHPASPKIVHDQMFGVARLYEYGVRCGAKPDQSRGLLALRDTNLRFFSALDTLRALHRDATALQEAQIRVDQLPRDLEGAAALADVTSGWKEGIAEADAHETPIGKLCDTIFKALLQGDAVAGSAAVDLQPRARDMEQRMSELSRSLKAQRDASRR
jgi:hypothetical protein